MMNLDEAKRAATRRARRFTSLAVLGTLALPGPSASGPLDVLEARLDQAFGHLDPARVPTGVLLDRVLPIARLERFDGSADAPPASPATVRQIVHELRRASLGPVLAPTPEELRTRGSRAAREGPIPIAVVDARVERIRADAGADGSLRFDAGRVDFAEDDLEELRVFAAAPLVSETRRGESVRFVVAPDLWMAWGHAVTRPLHITLDLDDGLGFRPVLFGETLAPSWSSTGSRTIRLRAEWPDGDVRVARFPFDVIRMGTPAPNDTLVVVASEPYQGTAASGRAYVYLAPGHASIENPIVVVEGFDLDDTMTWERLYELLNEQNLLEDMRALGFDAVVLDFDSATEPIQRNAFVVAELLHQIAATIDPAQDVFLVGASMGGLCARYALAWMESQSIDARVRTFLSFDAPHGGASVPLGIQYWLDYFASESVDAAFLLSRLDTPAARQMLLAHHTTPPDPTGTPDPLRGVLLADFASLGDWPASSRLVAVANGNGEQLDQGFAPAAQIIHWEYRSFLVDIDGNVWAVPNASSATIFHGRIDFVFLPPDEQTVVVSGTPPWDNAPGGSRDSMFQMDTTAAPYGDIVALHASHCFIPTVSALALPTSDLFFDVAGTPDVVALTPFQAVRWAEVNEEHVSISPETKAWVIAEVTAGATAAPSMPVVAPSGPLQLFSPYPNPFRESVAIRFSLEADAPVRAELIDVAGRRVARLLDEAHLPPGTHALYWKPETPGVYFIRLSSGAQEAVTRVTALE